MIRNNRRSLDIHNASIVQLDIQRSTLLARSILPVMCGLDVRDASVEMKSRAAQQLLINDPPCFRRRIVNRTIRETTRLVNDDALLLQDELAVDRISSRGNGFERICYQCVSFKNLGIGGQCNQRGHRFVFCVS